MRAIAVVLCLIAVLSAAPGAEASCHFCLDNTVDSCGGLDGDACVANVTDMGQHMPGHVLETVEETLDGSATATCATADVAC